MVSNLIPHTVPRARAAAGEHGGAGWDICILSALSLWCWDGNKAMLWTWKSPALLWGQPLTACLVHCCWIYVESGISSFGEW
jgi:hypothetical protein